MSLLRRQRLLRMAKPLTTDELVASLRKDAEEFCREHSLDVSKRKNKSTERTGDGKREEFNMMVNL